ncbi:hypothetical protein NQ318_004629 [Aromia moschata]|uniref:DUF4817 domain-containing protein n=1 Tax=Aromia moschata TaxID=1265417 RepID=A0AAV8Y6F1_9CUCU|nr:hypothetical protein NQ318_004629 [Aromia moschata]
MYLNSPNGLEVISKKTISEVEFWRLVAAKRSNMVYRGPRAHIYESPGAAEGPPPPPALAHTARGWLADQAKRLRSPVTYFMIGKGVTYLGFCDYFDDIKELEFETKCYFKLVKMSYLTESLKIEILMIIGYGDRARTQCEVVRLFRETHPDLPPLNQGTISKIEAQYREMGHVRKIPSKRQAVVDDDTKLNLLLALEENPITPARQLARDSICHI